MSEIINPVPFYTLEQAARELNKRLKTDGYDSKKILSLAIVYDLKLHIIACGWDCLCHYSHKINPDYLERKIQFSSESEYDFFKKIYRTINLEFDDVFMEILREGALLGLSRKLIQQIYAGKDADSRIFIDGVGMFESILGIDHINLDGFDPLMEATKMIRASLPYNHEDLELFKALEFTNIYAIELFTNVADNDFFIPSPSEAPSHVDEETGEAYYRPLITSDDVLITHKELERIITGNLQIKIPPLHDHPKYWQENHKQQPEKQLNTRSSKSVAKLILALSEMAKIDTSKPYAVYGSIQQQADLLGIENFPNDDTVAKWLNAAHEENPN